MHRLAALSVIPSLALLVSPLLFSFVAGGHERSADAGPVGGQSEYRVLPPVHSGELALFPVVRTAGRSSGADTFLTLDEGLRSGEIEVTEAGTARGMVRPRNGVFTPAYQRSGDQVNTLVLVNHSKRPVLLLAGEIVTGGKQDRIIAKDRIVPAGADPLDLSVFCVEHGRWTESSAKFNAAAPTPQAGFMVQPAVRARAMVDKDQQQVWNQVDQALTSMAQAAAPPKARPGAPSETVAIAGMNAASPVGAASLGTTSYAKAMQHEDVRAKVDQESAGALAGSEQTLKTLREEHAVGVVVALRGEIIWADVFSSPELLQRYWVKLVRSYAAEGLSVAASKAHAEATVADAQNFLMQPVKGHETSEGEIGVYRLNETRGDHTATFVLQSLLPDTGFDVHVSRLRVDTSAVGARPRGGMPMPVY